MNLDSNTIFITGGGTGIGRGLAEAFHKRGNKVIISGRREELLKDVCSLNEGMEYVPLDVCNSAQIQHVAEYLAEKFPALNCVINNAGVQRAFDFNSDETATADLTDEVETNFIALVQMCAAFIPHLKKQSQAALINVSSGLGLTPLSRVPVYSATKAAVHSFTMSLRHQLRGTPVEIIELIPPSVETELRAGRDEKHSGPPAMPLDEYIAETMKGLEAGEQEVAVGTAKFGQQAHEQVRQIFERMNSV